MIDKDFDSRFLAENSFKNEEWGSVVGWNNYMVSNMGRVYSKIRIKPNTKNYFCEVLYAVILKPKGVM